MCAKTTDHHRAIGSLCRRCPAHRRAKSTPTSAAKLRASSKAARTFRSRKFPDAPSFSSPIILCISPWAASLRKMDSAQAALTLATTRPTNCGAPAGTRTRSPQITDPGAPVSTTKPFTRPSRKSKSSPPLAAPPAHSNLSVHPYTLFNLYAQSISLDQLFYYGLGPNSLQANASVFGMTQTIAGANAIVPVLHA